MWEFGPWSDIWPRDKIAERLRRIRDDRARLEHKIAQAERPDLEAGRDAIYALLDLLEQPERLYQRAGERARKVLNKAIFTCLYLDATTAQHVSTATSRQSRSHRSSTSTGPNN